MALLRLRAEYRLYKRDKPEGIFLEPFKTPGEDDTIDWYTWRSVLDGPQGSPYEGGQFSVVLKFPKNYPFKPPKAYFTTKVFHPHVNSKTGMISLCLFCCEWSSSYTAVKLSQAVRQFLQDGANPEKQYLNVEAEKLFNSDREKYDEIVREWTQKYAKPLENEPEA